MPTVKSELKVRADKRPVAVVAAQDWEQVLHLVKKAPKEVMWFMTIDVDYTSHPAGIIYTLAGMFIPKQRCANKEVETEDGDAITKMWQEAGARLNVDPMDLASRGGCWAHSHVQMEVSPSPQDLTQWKEIIKAASKSNKKRPQAMLIVNQKDEITLHIYDAALGLEFESVRIELDKPWDMSWIDQEIKSKLTVMKGDTSSVQTSNTSGSSGSGTSGSSGGNGEVQGFVYTTLDRGASGK